MDDVTWWKRDLSSDMSPDRRLGGTKVPGDTNASDIVSRTGEEMPDVAHDEGDLDLPITTDDDPSDDMTTLPPEADDFER